MTLSQVSSEWNLFMHLCKSIVDGSITCGGRSGVGRQGAEIGAEQLFYDQVAH